jgi:hypothetical protein
MTDNVAITPGSGGLVAADEVVDGTLGTVKVQFIKIMDGTLDGTNKVTVKAGSTAPAAGDPALVVGISPNSVNANGQTTMSGSAPVTIASDQTYGNATGSAVPAKAMYGGANAITALPTAATAGNLVGMGADKFGRQIVLPVTVRDLVGIQPTTISTTTPTTIVTAGGSGVFTDLLSLIISNTSASTNTRVDITDGTVTFSLQSIGGAPPVGIPYMGTPIPATTANTAWTATLGTATTDIRIVAIYAKNK